MVSPNPPSPFEVRLSLEREAGREASAFAAGEAVVLLLVVRNASDTRQQLALPSAQTHDFTISAADGRELWRWSSGRQFAQMLTELAFAPGEEKRFRARWEPQAADGANAPSGSYRASGWIRAGPGRTHGKTVDFTID